MSLRIRAAQLRDLPAIEALYRDHEDRADGSGVPAGPLKRQFASRRLWFLLNNTFAAILPITSSADYLYVQEGEDGIRGFIQAQAAPAGRHVWQVINLCLKPRQDAFQAGTALLDQLTNEGLKRGVLKYTVRLPLDDPATELFTARGFLPYATEHGLLAENMPARPLKEVEGWRPMSARDQLALFTLYLSLTPRRVASVEGTNFKEWRHAFQQGWWASASARASRTRQFVIDRGAVEGWAGISAGSAGRPHILGLLGRDELWPELVDRALAICTDRFPGPVWCSLRHYQEQGISVLQKQGFAVIASELLLAKEIGLKLPARARVKIKEKRLVPQYG